MTRFRDRDAVTRIALIAWGVLLVGVSVRCAIWPRVHSLYPIYAQAGHHWAHGNSLYLTASPPYHTEYRYSPFTALLLVPLQALPEWLGGVGGRMLSALMFLLALRYWLSRGVPDGISSKQRSLIFLLTIPIAVTSLNNGQLNLPVIGLLVLACAATSESRWWLAGFCLALAIGVKIYPLALALLLWVAYPRQLSRPLLTSLLLVAGIPFLFQKFDYVLSQYVQWHHVLSIDDRKNVLPKVMYRDLWLIFHDLHIPMTRFGYFLVQFGSGLGCALLCLWARRSGWAAAATGTLALVLGSCWMLVCGPATEVSTFTILAPTLAYLTVKALAQETWPSISRYAPVGVYITFLLLHVTGVLPAAARDAMRTVAPGATLALWLAYVAAVIRELWQAKSPDELPGSAPPRLAA
jgi:hypothetical protein